jgi:hypothetical protein
VAATDASDGGFQQLRARIAGVPRPATSDRCAVHPGRPAADACPVCERWRCEADRRLAPGGGCLACEGRAAESRVKPVTRRSVVGAAAACHPVAVFFGAVSSQYVEVRWFEVLVPAGVGIGLGAVAEAGARGARGWWIRGVAVGYALLAAALGFRVEPSGLEPWDLRAVPAYLAAAVGAWLWTVPPKPKRPAEPLSPG